MGRLSASSSARSIESREISRPDSFIDEIADRISASFPSEDIGRGISGCVDWEFGGVWSWDMGDSIPRES